MLRLPTNMRRGGQVSQSEPRRFATLPSARGDGRDGDASWREELLPCSLWCSAGHFSQCTPACAPMIRSWRVAVAGGMRGGAAAMMLTLAVERGCRGMGPAASPRWGVVRGAPEIGEAARGPGPTCRHVSQRSPNGRSERARRRRIPGRRYHWSLFSVEDRRIEDRRRYIETKWYNHRLYDVLIYSNHAQCRSPTGEPNSPETLYYSTSAERICVQPVHP